MGGRDSEPFAMAPAGPFRYGERVRTDFTVEVGADVEVTDVATPLSYEHYTGNWQESSCGWLLTKKTMLKMITGMPHTLPGLRNLVLAGQWVEPGGGVPMCAGSGCNAVRPVCAAEGVPFRTVHGP